MVNLETDWAWSTNRPLLKALVKEFNPELIVEIGVGAYSTTCLNTQPNYIGIDSDEEWLDKLNEEISFSGNHEFRYQDIGQLPLATKTWEVSKEQMSSFDEYYQNLKKEIDLRSESLKMLFVDNHTCCRTSAINNAGPAFDIIGYHDCEPAGIEWYSYYFSEDIKNNYKKYYLKTWKSWTGVFIKNDLSHNLFETINPFILEYNREIGTNSGSVLEQVPNNE